MNQTREKQEMRRDEWMQKLHQGHMKQVAEWRRKVLAVQLSLLVCMFCYGSWRADCAGLMCCCSVIRAKFLPRLARTSPVVNFGSMSQSPLGRRQLAFAGDACRNAACGPDLVVSFLSKVLDPYMVVFNSMPKVALGPIFIVMFGAGFTAIVMTTLSITVIITTLVVYNSFNEVDSNYIKVIRTFGGDRSEIFTKVVLPASFPAIVSTLKVNVGMAWVGVIVGEFLVAKQGLGYLIIYGFQVFNFTLVLSSLLIIAAVATAMYQLVVYVERKLLAGRR